jgi:hypothetical protein
MAYVELKPNLNQNLEGRPAEKEDTCEEEDTCEQEDTCGNKVREVQGRPAYS